MDAGQFGSLVASVSWPRQIRPGDNIVLRSGLRVLPRTDPLRIRIDIGSAIAVSGGDRKQGNVIVVPPSKGEIVVPLRYSSQAGSAYPTRHDIVLEMLQLRPRWTWYVALAAVVAFGATPLVLKILESSVASVRIEWGPIAILSLPLGLVVGAMLSAVRVSQMARQWVYQDRVVEYLVCVTGPEDGFVEIVKEIDHVGHVTWTNAVEWIANDGAAAVAEVTQVPIR